MQGNSLRRTALALSALSLAASAWAQSPPAPPKPPVDSIMTTRVDSEIAIDPSGALIDYRSETPLPDDVKTSLERQVRAWRFEPVLVQGKPVTAKARMRVTLAARQLGEERYAVTVDNVTFPATGYGVLPDAPPAAVTISSRKIVAPSYPEGLARARVGGVVLLYLRLSADGRVLEAAPVQTSLLNVYGSDKALAKGVAALEQATARAARSWQFNVQLHTDHPSARDLTVSMPVEFQAPGMRETRPGQWRTEVRGARREPAWLQSDAGNQRIGVSDVDAGDVVPLASAIKLASEVKGVAL